MLGCRTCLGRHAPGGGHADDIIHASLLVGYVALVVFVADDKRHRLLVELLSLGGEHERIVARRFLLQISFLVGCVDNVGPEILIMGFSNAERLHLIQFQRTCLSRLFAGQELYQGLAWYRHLCLQQGRDQFL